MFILGLAMVGLGYAVAYYGANILVDAYLRTGTMNPAPLTVLLGIPQSNTQTGTAPAAPAAGGQ